MKKILLSMVLGFGFACGGGELQRSDSYASTSSSYESKIESPAISWFPSLFCCGCAHTRDEHELDVEDIGSDMGNVDVSSAQVTCRPLQSAAAVQAYHEQSHLRHSGFGPNHQIYKITYTAGPLVQTVLVKERFGHSESSTSAEASVGPSVALSDMGFSDELENGSVNLSRSQSFDSQHSYIKLSNGQIKRLVSSQITTKQPILESLCQPIQ